jgi:hypothetical protein
MVRGEAEPQGRLAQWNAQTLAPGGNVEHAQRYERAKALVPLTHGDRCEQTPITTEYELRDHR